VAPVYKCAPGGVIWGEIRCPKKLKENITALQGLVSFLLCVCRAEKLEKLFSGGLEQRSRKQGEARAGQQAKNQSGQKKKKKKQSRKPRSRE
jgi:hypothetical protein